MGHHCHFEWDNSFWGRLPKKSGEVHSKKSVPEKVREAKLEVQTLVHLGAAQNLGAKPGLPNGASGACPGLGCPDLLRSDPGLAGNGKGKCRAGADRVAT